MCCEVCISNSRYRPVFIIRNQTQKECCSLHNQIQFVGILHPPKIRQRHIDASFSRQPLVKGERLVRHEVNAVMHVAAHCISQSKQIRYLCLYYYSFISHQNLQTSSPGAACRYIMKYLCLTVLWWQKLISRLPLKKYCYG